MYPLNEKMVVVDSYSIGEQINYAYNSKGHHTINLKFRTAYELALEIIDQYLDTPRKILDSIVAEQLIYTMLIDLKKENKLDYFAGIEITPSFSKAIYSTIKHLRMAGYSKIHFPHGAFLNPAKGKDLFEMLEKYENMLEANRLFDEGEILRTALRHAHKKEDRFYALQSNLPLTFLEEELLRKLLPESTFKLPLDEVRGIQIPERTSISTISWGQASPLSYIYDLEHSEGEVGLTFFAAKTEELEMKEVLARIKSSQSKLDENVIYYTNAQSYVTLLYHLSQAADIPVTFGDGLPISFSRPGRLVNGLLKWIHTNYSVKVFLNLVQEGLLDLGEGAPSKVKIAGYLRDLQIGWSKERYVMQINQEVLSLTSLIEKTENGERKDYLQKRLHDLKWLAKWFRTIFKHLPRYDVVMNYQKCLEGISYIIRNHCSTNSALNEKGKSSILDMMSAVIPYADDTRSTFEIFEKIKDLLLSIRINQSKPKPGHLHAASYKSGIYNSRPNVFIVGLNNRDFPGGVNEDPLLLDRERKKLGRNIPILQSTNQENLYSMLQLLAHSTGSVTISYSNFDINANRAVSPSHLFLQCYRLATGKKSADFKELKDIPSSLIIDEIIENKDYWNQKLDDENPKFIEQSIWNYYENMKYGIKSETFRHASDFTEYDGLINADSDSLDPRVNKVKRVSAAKLEMLAKCPYSFFLQDVLRVRPIEDVEFNPNKWLDAATRGSLLHRIFETFYKELENEKPSVEKHEEKILSIARIQIDEQKELIPPPNDRIFIMEANDILECSRIFLKEEEIHCESHKPLYFEYTFGLDEHEPAVITLPSGATIQVAGKIDRVDESNSGHYHIIDYKTGSTYGYGNKQIFRGGRQLQHMLYAQAIEQHLNLEIGSVHESSYYFPTVKGMAERIVRKQNEVVRKNGIEILESLIDVLRSGTFTMTDDVNDCKFCEFKSVCRRQFYDIEVLEAKQIDPNKEVLRRFKGVRAYE